MLSVYRVLAGIARREFGDVVQDISFIGGSPADPDKLRLQFVDGSFLDIWVSVEGEYSFHWECRAQRGYFYRWDNAPHHPQLKTYPHHMHFETEGDIRESFLSPEITRACKEVLSFIRAKLKGAAEL